MSTREQEPTLHERVTRLESGNEAVLRTLGEMRQDMKDESARVWQEMKEIRQDMKDGFALVRQEMQEIRQDMKDGFARAWQETQETREEIRSMTRHFDLRLDSWLKWVLGFILSSWLTTITSIWLKR